MISYGLLIGVSIAALLGVFLLVRGMHKLGLRVQFLVLLGLGVSIGFIFLVMVQMRSFGTRIFLRSLVQEDQKTEDEARDELRRSSHDSGLAAPRSARPAP
jgi:hypothetical protein